MADKFAARVSRDMDVAIKAIQNAIKDVPELQQMEAVLVGNALGYVAMQAACTQGYDAARSMFRDLLKMVDVYEQENQAN